MAARTCNTLRCFRSTPNCLINLLVSAYGQEALLNAPGFLFYNSVCIIKKDSINVCLIFETASCHWNLRLRQVSNALWDICHNNATIKPHDHKVHFSVSVSVCLCLCPCLSVDVSVCVCACERVRAHAPVCAH